LNQKGINNLPVKAKAFYKSKVLNIIGVYRLR
jgi:hypothetical protein